MPRRRLMPVMPRRRARREMAPWQADALKMVLSAFLTVVCVLTLAPPTRADNQCKPAGLPQSKCTKDAQCCSGLCVAGRCQAGCGIEGVFYAPNTVNPANVCESCQPTENTTAWTNLPDGTRCINQGGASCDDATCSAGSCTADPAASCLVFVTSTAHDGNLGGLAGADTICQDLAEDAGLGGTFKAWLSESAVSARARLTPARVPYSRVDSIQVVAGEGTRSGVGDSIAAIAETEDGDNRAGIVKQVSPESAFVGQARSIPRGPASPRRPIRTRRGGSWRC